MAKGEATRNRIIEKSAPLFNKYGLAGVSISDIMAATELQKGGIYRHFDSKEEIALAAFDYNVGQLTRHVMGGLSAQTPAPEALSIFLRNFVALPSLLDGGCAVLNTAIEHDDGHPELRARAQQAIGVWRKTLYEILRRGVREGVFREELNLEGTVSLYISALEGSVMLTRLEGDTAHMQRVIDQLLDHARQFVFAS
jgi:TetR/AcrR family transcriptional regulator, transcriptional repressor for nem operon